MQRLRRHLSYANVTATLALVIAIAGGTTAIAGSAKAPKNSVVSTTGATIRTRPSNHVSRWDDVYVAV